MTVPESTRQIPPPRGFAYVPAALGSEGIFTLKDAGAPPMTTLPPDAVQARFLLPSMLQLMLPGFVMLVASVTVTDP